MSSEQLLQEPGAKGECGPSTLLKTEAVGTGELGTARDSMDMLEKVLEDSETEEQEQEPMESGRRKQERERRRKT